MQLQFVQKRSDRSIPEIQRVEGLNAVSKEERTRKIKNWCYQFQNIRTYWNAKQLFADVLKNFAIFTGKHLCWPEVLQLYLKETTTMVFSCEYCTIFKHSPFYKTPLVDLILINAMKPERTHDKTKLQGINGIQQKPFTGVL